MSSTIKIKVTEKELQVRVVPYSDWLVRSLKQSGITNGFRSEGKYWSVPHSRERELQAWAVSYPVEYDTREKVAAAIRGKIPEMPTWDESEELPVRTDKFRPFKYQSQGMAYLKEHPKAIIADEPGLGKTVQAVGGVEIYDTKCVLIICPSTLKLNWKHEIENIWTHHKAMVLSDRTINTWHLFNEVGHVKYFITNFESLKKYFVRSINIPEGEELLLKHIEFDKRIERFDAVIIDEVHRCKEGKTQSAKFVMGLTKNKPVVFALSGTPVVNKTKDLVAQLHIIGRLGVFNGYKEFVRRYCAKKVGKEYLAELNLLMHQNCFFRRLKKDVLTDLPDKMRRVVRCEITNRPEYNKAEEKLREYLRENLEKTEAQITKAMRGEVMVRLQLLKQISARGKMEYIIDQVQQVIDAGEKMVLFAWHTEIVHAFQKAFPKALRITGEDDIDERETAKNKFQTDPEANLIILNIKAGGVGLTLTASSRVGFIELPWHSADSDQCEDRCHRIGQKDSVDVSFFLGHNTVDEMLYKIIESKRKLASDIIGVDEIETQVVDEFINLFTADNRQEEEAMEA